MRVLALVPGGVSEQLLFFPTLEHLKQAFPQAEISVVVEPAAKAAYRVSTLVKEVFPYDFQQRNSPSDWANLLGTIRDREFEVVLTTTQSGSLSLLLWLSGVPTRVGYNSSANSLFLTATVPQKTAQYQGLQYHDLLTGLQISGPGPSATINVPQKDIDWVNSQLKRQGIDDQGYVLIYGGPTDEPSGQSYPAESWVAIVQDFQARPARSAPSVTPATRDHRARPNPEPATAQSEGGAPRQRGPSGRFDRGRKPDAVHR